MFDDTLGLIESSQSHELQKKEKAILPINSLRLLGTNSMKKGKKYSGHFLLVLDKDQMDERNIKKNQKFREEVRFEKTLISKEDGKVTNI